MGRRTDIIRETGDLPALWRSDDDKVTILALKNGGATLQVTVGSVYMGAEIAPAEVVEILTFFKDISHADPIDYNLKRASADAYLADIRRREAEHLAAQHAHLINRIEGETL